MSEILFQVADPVALTIRSLPVNSDGRSWTQLVVTINDDRPGVVIIAEHDGNYLLGRQLRPSVGQWLWEFPRGFGASAVEAAQVEPAEIAARRELQEETGISSTESTVLGRFWPDSGLLSGAVDAVHIAVGTNAATNLGPTDGELAATAWFHATEIDTMIAENQLCDGLSLAAWAIFRARSSQR